jgi:hypothetical protein
MATFSVTEAAGSGFKIAFGRPLSVLVWGLAYLLLVGVPVALVFAWAGPDLINFIHAVAQRAHDEIEAPFDPSMMMPFQGKMMLLQPVLFLSGLLGRAVLAGAVFRAVLEPRNRGFAGLRIGAQELWLAVLFLAYTILMVLFVIAVALACGLVGLALTAALGAAHLASVWTTIVWIVACLIAIVVFIWVMLRFSLAFPMTFAEREFRLFESWSLTKGRAWKLLGLALLLAVVMFAVVLVLDGAIFGIVFGTGMAAFNDQGERMIAFFHQPPEVWMRALAPWAAVFLLVGSWLTAALTAILLAPWAVAYKGLAAGLAGGGGEAPVLAPYPADPAPPVDHADHGHLGH